MSLAPRTFTRSGYGMGLSPVRGGQRHNTGLVPYSISEDTPSRRVLTPATLGLVTEFKSTNVIYWARRGQGKSLSMVAVGKMLSPGFKRAGWQIKSNIEVAYADYCHPFLGTIIANDLYKAERSLILQDEITELIPSRRAMSRTNITSLSVTRQIRKLRCELHCTTQFPTDVDKQMLKQLDLWVLCQGYFPKDSRWNWRSAQRANVVLWVFDLWGQFSDKGLQKNLFPPPLNMAIRRIVLRNLPNVWNDYDTYKLVASEHSSEEAREKLVSRQWDREKLDQMEEADERANMDPTLREFEQTVAARFAEQADAPYALPPPTAFNIMPTSLAEWLTNKRMGGRFRVVSAAILHEIRPFAPHINKLRDLINLLMDNNFAVEHNNDGSYYAEPIRHPA